MENEAYLIWSYFSVGAFSILIGVAAFVWLRRAAQTIFASLPQQPLCTLLSRFFRIGIVLPAIGGFMSVDLHGCQKTYDQIIADRAYMFSMNQQQVSMTLTWLYSAVLAWALVITLILIATRHGKGRRAP